MTDQAGAVDAHADAVRTYYDTLDELYEHTGNAHIHHGYWAEDAPLGTPEDAQLRLTEKVISVAGVPAGARVLDAGCGVGGTAVLLAQAHRCHVDGITLSERQVRRATRRAEDAGVAATTRFRVLDALVTDYPDGAFDVVIALESCEVMPDKARFLGECARVLRPGGTLVVATWCASTSTPTAAQQELLDTVCADFVLPYVLTLPEYARLCRSAGLTDVRTEDWTGNVRATWEAETRNRGARPDLAALAKLRAVDLVRLADSAEHMRRAYAENVIRYGVLRATKPNLPES